MYPIGTKLGVSELFYTHVGAYYGNGKVFHNHWKNGAEIISMEEFASGKTITVLEQGVADQYAFFIRVQQALSAPRPFNFLTNNCEHATSLVRSGVAASPQVTFYGVLGLVALGALTMSRGVRA
ncbi:MAG: hypothetical protein AMXMBFR37_05870 [Steroidobacteraceae bacterium]